MATSGAYLLKNLPLLAPLYLGFAVSALGSYGAGAWNATYLIRTFHMSAAAIGRELGPASMLAGAVGALLGGVAADRASRTGRISAKFKVAMFMSLIATVSVLLAFAPGPFSAIAVICVMTAAVPMVSTTVIAAVQEIAPANARGIAVSLFGFVNTIIGAVGGPLLIALATDKVLGAPSDLKFAMPLVIVPAAICASLIFLSGLTGVQRRAGMSDLPQLGPA